MKLTLLLSAMLATLALARPMPGLNDPIPIAARSAEAEAEAEADLGDIAKACVRKAWEPCHNAGVKVGQKVVDGSRVVKSKWEALNEWADKVNSKPWKKID